MMSGLVVSNKDYLPVLIGGEKNEEYERQQMRDDMKNPVIQGLYADPDLYYEDGTYFLYPTTDGFPHWSGSKFYVFVSKDGKSFEKKAQILDVASEDVPWAAGSAWAPCIAKKGEHYYYYFCAKNQSGSSCIGVAVSESPTGPFKAMEESMVTMGMMEKNKIRMCQVIDPSLYQEDDKWYLLFGNGDGAIARLTEDMLHIEESTLKNIEGLYDFRESVMVLKRNGMYHFTWSCDDTGSEDYHVNYGVAKDLYGSVTFRETILQKNLRRGILGTGHHSILKIPEEDRYVIAYHRFAMPLENYPEENGKGWYREICLASLYFDKKGYMMSVVVE